MAILVISYSRADHTLVRAVVTLLKSASRDVERAVFWDADIEPGDQWWTELQRHIDEAPQLFVFWCDHSSRSIEVKREFSYALGQGKRVVPVLLDDTPLSSELTSINGIDLRQAVVHPRDDRLLGGISRRFGSREILDGAATVAAFSPFLERNE